MSSDESCELLQVDGQVWGVGSVRGQTVAASGE